MAEAAKEKYEADRENNQSNVRHLVTQAIDQVKQGQIKDLKIQVLGRVLCL